MPDNHLRHTCPAPEGCQKRFEKTHSRMVYYAIKGAWGCFPNKLHRCMIGQRCPACDERKNKKAQYGENQKTIECLNRPT